MEAIAAAACARGPPAHYHRAPMQLAAGGRSEASCPTCGWKSRRRRSPCGAVVISGRGQGDLTAGSPDVKALGGRVGSEPLRSDQHRGRATRRAVAKANGISAEIANRLEADGRTIGDAKVFPPQVDGQCRYGRTGRCPYRVSRRTLKAAILESWYSESSEGLETRQEDP
jgi:hypothetical protein